MTIDATTLHLSPPRRPRYPFHLRPHFSARAVEYHATPKWLARHPVGYKEAIPRFDLGCMIDSASARSVHLRPHPKGNLLHTMSLVFVSRMSTLLLFEVPDHVFYAYFSIPQSIMVIIANLKPNTILKEDISNSCSVSRK